MVELKQNGRCISCKQPITEDHTVLSRGRPRSYYHKLCYETSYNMISTIPTAWERYWDKGRVV